MKQIQNLERHYSIESSSSSNSEGKLYLPRPAVVETFQEECKIMNSQTPMVPQYLTPNKNVSQLMARSDDLDVPKSLLTGLLTPQHSAGELM